MKTFLKNYAATLIMAAIGAAMLGCAGCAWMQPRIESLNSPGKQVTWDEWVAEYQVAEASLNAKAEAAMASYERQVQTRTLGAQILMDAATKIPGMGDLAAPIFGLLAIGGVLDGRRVRKNAKIGLQGIYHEDGEGTTPAIDSAAKLVGIDPAELVSRPRSAARIGEMAEISIP